ncbi:hypothetical protein Tco_1059274, partial [Tanacetum coccineum]
AGNPVKDILLKLNLPNHRIFKDGGEGMSMSIQKSRVHKVAKLQDGEKRLCLVDDLKVDPHGFEGIFKDGDGVRVGGQYLLKNFVFKSSQVVIEPDGLFLSQRLAAPVKDIGKALSITWSIVILGMWNKSTISRTFSICSFASS